MIRVTVWNENVHDRTDERVKAIYPGGLHSAIAAALVCLAFVRGGRRVK